MQVCGTTYADGIHFTKEGVEDMSTKQGVWVLMRDGNLVLHEGAVSSSFSAEAPLLEVYNEDGVIVARYLDWIGSGHSNFMPQPLRSI